MEEPSDHRDPNRDENEPANGRIENACDDEFTRRTVASIDATLRLGDEVINDSETTLESAQQALQQLRLLRQQRAARANDHNDGDTKAAGDNEGQDNNSANSNNTDPQLDPTSGQLTMIEKQEKARHVLENRNGVFRGFEISIDLTGQLGMHVLKNVPAPAVLTNYLFQKYGASVGKGLLYVESIEKGFIAGTAGIHEEDLIGIELKDAFGKPNAIIFDADDVSAQIKKGGKINLVVIRKRQSETL